MLTMPQQLKQLDKVLLQNLAPSEIDLNYINYTFGFIVLGYKMTRVYSSINRFYGILVFLHVIVAAILNLIKLSAFRVLFKASGIRFMSARIEQSSLKHLVNADDLYAAHNSTHPHSGHSADAMFLANDHLLIAAFLTAWTLSLLYLSALNFFGYSFFSQAQLKITCKYEQCLNQFLANQSSHAGKLKPRCKSGLQIEYKPILSKIGVQNQYKAILAGIVFLLATELFQIPFAYIFYMNYLRKNLDIFLVALCGQLAYLVFNALFWILLSFKPDWTVRFTPNYRVLYWNRLFTQYFHAQNSKKVSSL